MFIIIAIKADITAGIIFLVVFLKMVIIATISRILRDHQDDHERLLFVPLVDLGPRPCEPNSFSALAGFWGCGVLLSGFGV